MSWWTCALPRWTTGWTARSDSTGCVSDGWAACSNRRAAGRRTHRAPACGPCWCYSEVASTQGMIRVKSQWHQVCSNYSIITNHHKYICNSATRSFTIWVQQQGDTRSTVRLKGLGKAKCLKKMAQKRVVLSLTILLHRGNSNVTDITFQRFLETLGAHFIYLQVLNLKSFTAITKQSSWIVHPMRLRSIFWISYEISYIMTAVTDITFFGSHILHTNTFVEKSVSLWISQRHFHYWCNDKIMYLCFLGTFCENCWACTV